MSSTIEILRPDFARGDFRAVIFDFDGTLSLLRRNWEDVMIPQMVEVLQATGTEESAEQLRAVVEDFVSRLTGKQTIYQMIQLADEVGRRGGEPLEPLQYKHAYHDRLWQEVGRRVESVRGGETPPEELTVPGAKELVETLAARQLQLYLASGTDEHYVKDELAVLGLDRPFQGRVYGAQDDYRRFSKAQLIQQVLTDTDVQGPQLLGFGDGYVEIEEIRRVGGVAVGVASDETHPMRLNPVKRERLIRAGADVIIPHYLPLDPLLETLGLGLDTTPTSLPG